jgi:NAD(P)-dependent dehydrogenase (short-subunit alcohol dehydrogenase family)
MSEKIILVTGANKGIGFEIARQLAKQHHTVILTARDAVKGRKAVDQLVSENLSVHFQQLDIGSELSIQQAAVYVKSEFGRLDVLINNAAILLKEDQSLLANHVQVMDQTVHTNALAQLSVIRGFVSLISQQGRIIMTSSGGGSMTDPVGGWSPAYCVSKSFLNAITRHMAYELSNRKISVNAFCPGWVKTDMGGQSAPRSVEQGADTAVWLATSELMLSGKFFRDRQVIPW